MKTDKKIRLTIGNNWQHKLRHILALSLRKGVPTGKNILNICYKVFKIKMI